MNEKVTFDYIVDGFYRNNYSLRSLTPYIEQMDGYEKVWFMMQMNNDVIWLY